MEFDAVIKQAVAKNPTLIRAATSITRADLLLQQSRLVLLSDPERHRRQFHAGWRARIRRRHHAAAESVDVCGQRLHAGARAGAVGPDPAVARSDRGGRGRHRRSPAADLGGSRTGVPGGHRRAASGGRHRARARVRARASRLRHQAVRGRRREPAESAARRADCLERRSAPRSDSERACAPRRKRSACSWCPTARSMPAPTRCSTRPGTMDESAWRAARPDIITQAAIQRAAERVVRDSKLDWFPNVNASFDPSYVTPSGLFSPKGTWRFTLSSTYVFFDGGSRQLAGATASSRSSSRRSRCPRFEIQARSEVRLAQETVRSRQRSLDSARRAAAAGRRSGDDHHDRVRSRRDDEPRSDRRAARGPRHRHGGRHRRRCAQSRQARPACGARAVQIAVEASGRRRRAAASKTR